MTLEQIALARTAREGMTTISLDQPTPHSAESLSDILQRHNLHNASINIRNMTATGFSPSGLNNVIALAKSFRASQSSNIHRASTPTLAKFIAGEIISRWENRPATSLTSVDFTALGDAVGDWFSAQARVLQHVVPCTLFPHRVSSIAVGPVIFHHIQDFPTETFGIARAEFWPAEPPRWKRWLRNVWAAVRERPVQSAKPGGFHFEQLVELAAQRHAPWMAIVDVPGRAPMESRNAADIATDIALASIQLISPGSDMRGIARATARAAPVWRADVARTEDGRMSISSGNTIPALARSQELIAEHMEAASPFLQSMGRRLAAYLSATSPLPELDEAWCNAAYWYHEALAEHLDTVAVAKLETAIEVLFRAESMSGSKQRLLSSFDAIFGLKASDAISPQNSATVEQLVIAITTARSRIFHGTWPTLHTDLPSAKGKPPTSYADVETLARLLLLNFSLQLDAYQQAGETVDSTDAFLAWIKAQRTTNNPPSTP
ncbi:hypothetical protein [Agrobacterium tumefaciens]|nr:hypothetical protein [Agrobacterium tumefaciens]